VHQSSSLTIAVTCEVQEATDLYVMCAGELFSAVVEVDLVLHVKKDLHGPHSSTADPCPQLHLVGLLAIKKLRKLLQEPL
jgi:2-keto-4-pentenoate hydratase